MPHHTQGKGGDEPSEQPLRKKKKTKDGCSTYFLNSQDSMVRSMLCSECFSWYCDKESPAAAKPVAPPKSSAASAKAAKVVAKAAAPAKPAAAGSVGTAPMHFCGVCIFPHHEARHTCSSVAAMLASATPLLDIRFICCCHAD